MPEPAHSRVLLEMASDLEALYDHYRARGLDEDEAVRLTEERLVASPAALQQLVMVHTTGYQRWLSRATGGLRLGFDLVLFVLAVVPLLAFSGQVVGAQLRGGGAGVLTGIVMGIGGVITGITLFKAYQLFVRRERSAARLHRDGRWLRSPAKSPRDREFRVRRAMLLLQSPSENRRDIYAFAPVLPS